MTLGNDAAHIPPLCGEGTKELGEPKLAFFTPYLSI